MIECQNKVKQYGKNPATFSQTHTNNKFVRLDTTIVKYKWWDYLPGDEIHSIKDLWSLD